MIAAFPSSLGAPALGEGFLSQHAGTRHSHSRFLRRRYRRHDDLDHLVGAARHMRPPPDRRARAQRYIDWARKQIDLAEQTIGDRARAQHVALAERYLRLAEKELVAIKRRVEATPRRGKTGELITRCAGLPWPQRASCGPCSNSDTFDRAISDRLPATSTEAQPRFDGGQ